MATQTSFWQRVSTLFRPDDHVGAETPLTPPRPTTTATVTPAETPRPLTLLDNSATPWWRRRQVRQAQSQEMALRVYELAGAMQQHFRQQDQRAAELAGSLDRVGGVLEQLAGAQRAQGEFLRSIAERTDVASKHAAALTETLSRMPDSLMTQAEAIRTVARQLEVSQESDTQLMHSLQQFGRAVDTLGESGTAQVEVLHKLNAAQRAQHDTLTTLVREQSRRFVIVLVVASLVAVAGLAALGGTLLLVLRRMA
jgi:hypothetical protein